MLPFLKPPFFFILLLLVCQCAAPLNSFAAAAPAAATSDTANYFRVIWGLLVVLGIILVLYGLVKKRFSLLTTGENQEIKIIEIKPLMGKKALCLISVKGQEHLLGISGDNITHIAALTPQPPPSFAEVLQATGQVRP
jgi:flagellar protein FliO/FliZ